MSIDTVLQNEHGPDAAAVPPAHPPAQPTPKSEKPEKVPEKIIVGARSEKKLSRRIHHLFRKISNSNRGGHIALVDALKAAGRKGEAMLILLPATIAISPLSAIPGVASCMGLFASFIALQMLLERRPFWIPPFMRNLRIKKRRLRSFIKRVKPAVHHVSKATDERMQYMFTPGWQKVALLCCCILSFLQMPLELIPLGHSIPALLVILFGIGFVAQDGAFIIAGFTGIGVAVAAVIGGYIYFDNHF